MEGGFLDHNPAWRTYRYAGKKKEKVIADEATTQRLITALEEESLKYETYFKLIIATGMRRGECCGLQWGDINWQERSIHIQRNVVKVTGEDIIVKETKTMAGDRYVYFSLEMESLLKEFQRECSWETETYDGRKLEDADYVFRRHGYRVNPKFCVKSISGANRAKFICCGSRLVRLPPCQQHNAGGGGCQGRRSRSFYP